VNVEFDEEDTRKSTLPPSKLNPLDLEDHLSNGLYFEGIRGSYISDHIAQFDTSLRTWLGLTRCSLSAPLPPSSSWNLLLKGITDPADLHRACRQWHGEFLDIADCPAFNDEFINRSLIANIEGESDLLCPALERLHIKNPACSVKVLRLLVESRSEHPDAQIVELVVCGGPPLFRDDRDWFEGNVQSEFEWEESLPA